MLFLLELFHGPTLAFKDYALQLVGRLFDHVLARAASASRSSAPPRATPARRRSRPAATAHAIDIFILYPKGRISEVQRRQMTTVDAPNVHNIAHRRHVRRLPGPREGDVRRRRRSATSCSSRRSTRSTGRASRRRSSTTSTAGAGARARPRARSPSRCRPAISATSTPGYAARQMGLPIAALHHRLQPQRHPRALPRDGRDGDGAGRAVASPEHGHPGVEQFRAPAVRARAAATAPRVAGHDAPTSAAAAACKLDRDAACAAARAVRAAPRRRRDDARHDPPRLSRRPASSSIRTPPSASRRPRRGATARVAAGGARHRASGEIPRRGRARDGRAAAAAAAPRRPLSSGRSASRRCPTIFARCRTSSRGRREGCGMTVRVTTLPNGLRVATDRDGAGRDRLARRLGRRRHAPRARGGQRRRPSARAHGVQGHDDALGAPASPRRSRRSAAR